MLIPGNLIRKYSIPGPRYTSYPTVPYWDAVPAPGFFGPGWLDHMASAIGANARKGIGASIYVHIPFCRSICAYCGCNTRLTRDNSQVGPYIDALHSELDLYCRAGTFRLSELHIGGGSPTFLPPPEMARLIDGILDRVDANTDAGLSAEADPRTTTREHLEVLAARGFRRISFGVQDLDPAVQQLIGRIQGEDLVRRVTLWARELGFTSINFDLIHGLPAQTTASIERTMAATRELRPDRIAFYANAYVPWLKPHQKKYSEKDLPSPELRRTLYEYGRTALENAGYLEIGMDHFALGHDALWLSFQSRRLHRNFMGYTPRFVSPLIGLGVSSIGDTWNAFAQNEKVLEPYMAAVLGKKLPLVRGHELDSEDLVLRRHILNLMTRYETDWSDEKAHTPYLDLVGEKLSGLSRDGLVVPGPSSCAVTETGRAFLRNICMAFDARLARKSPDRDVFSKTT
ncbi:MAG: oxygen-independent coproporphyrinogen III oxidase [Bdellovibrionales bacterium RIFOXYD1_FULL_53_11]|nr:MAG: oxygen-independent coproporphyrinogen III oxidase [Bdellovibrionales bacterium RIFOXYD1_FULL_53_11]